MITIKVFHQGDKNTFRRFVISNKATWSELEAKIRSLFSISASTPFILSYVDEDNDVITLSTDTELQEVLSSREPTSTIKFNLKISALDNLSDGEDSNNEAWVFEGSPQRTASVDTPDNKDKDNDDDVPQKNITSTTNQEDNDDDVPQKNITSTTNQEAQSVESDSGEVGEVSSNKRLLLDDDLYEEGTSSTKKNSMNEFYKSFDALGFVPTITPLNEDKGKQKEPIGESSSINVSSSLSSSSSSLLEQNQKSPQEHQNNQPSQEDQNNSPLPSPTLQGQNNQPTLSVYDLADNFQKLIDKFQEEAENNPKYAKDSLSKLHQLIRSISAQLPPLDEDNQSQDNQRDQRYNVQQQSHSQSRRNNDDFFDNPPPLFIRQPPIPGSFPTPPKSVPCPWASQARPDSESYEPHHHTKNRRRRRRHRRHHHNRDYERHEPKEETQETQEEREEEILENEEMLVEAQERMREEMQERAQAQEVREEEQELRDVRELRKANELSPYQEQIDILNNMGFWPDEDQYVELLTMYEGNIEQVVECLLERQSRSQ